MINDQKPIWVEPKSQVTEEQYIRFYQHLTHHPDEKPLWHLHMAADSPIQFRAIVYCPPTNLENLGFARLEHGLSLCAKRVLVQSECRELLPEYLRFLRGLVDSEDLPLNVSRETLQDNSDHPQDSHIDRQERARPARPAGAGRRRELYRKFYDQFGRVLKEGLDRRPANHERIAKLLLFASSRSDDPQARVSFDEYIAKMPENQKQIYYQAGGDFASIAKSPNLEIFRRRGIEVLFLTDPVDEFALNVAGDLSREEAHLDRLRGHRDSRSERVRGERGREHWLGREGEWFPQGPRAIPRGARDRG